MRFLLFFGLFLLLPYDASAKPARKPASFGGTPARVITFTCRETPDDPALGLGIAYLRVDPKDANAATVGLSLYVQNKRNSFVSKTYQGSAALVPGGYSLSVQSGDSFVVHLHPHERTVLPGLPGRPVSCESNGMVTSGP
ncbi:MAG: hypothetical protein AB7K68_10300 [Bacteriovoracia bacterium]